MFKYLLSIVFSLFFLPYLTVPYFYYYFEPFLVTLFFAFSFLIPIFALENQKSRYIRYRVVNFKTMRLSVIVLMVFILIGIIATLKNSSIVNFPPESMADIFAISAESAGRRYKGEVSVSFLGKIGLVSSYLLVLLFSYYTFHNKKSIKILFLGFLLILFLAIVLGSKAILLYSLVLFIANYSVLLPHSINKLTLINYRQLVYWGAALSILIFLFFILMQSMRYSISILDAFSALWFQFLVYSQGHVAGFHQFFMYEYDNSGYLFGGSQTFYGVFELLQISVESNYIDSPKLIGSDATTNVDTIFRDLILDFGVIGSGILLLFVGFIFSFLSYKSICHRVFLGFRTSVVSVLLWSFANSILTYSTIIVALILNTIFLVFFLKSS